jgi:hypothetical protein
LLPGGGLPALLQLRRNIVERIRSCARLKDGRIGWIYRARHASAVKGSEDEDNKADDYDYLSRIGITNEETNINEMKYLNGDILAAILSIVKVRPK